MDFRLLHLIATVIDALDHPPGRGLGHPPTETIRVVATLRRFLREGTPWRSLIASTKYHIATDGDGVPVACAATAANVNDTLAFERLFLTAFAVMARIQTVFADKGYDAERHRNLCRTFGAAPRIHRRFRPSESGLGRRRWLVERSLAWVPENSRLALRYDRLGFVIQSLLQAACIFLVAGRLAREF